VSREAAELEAGWRDWSSSVSSTVTPYEHNPCLVDSVWNHTSRFLLDSASSAVLVMTVMRASKSKSKEGDGVVIGSVSFPLSELKARPGWVCEEMLPVGQGLASMKQTPNFLRPGVFNFGGAASAKTLPRLIVRLRLNHLSNPPEPGQPNAPKLPRTRATTVWKDGQRKFIRTLTRSLSMSMQKERIPSDADGDNVSVADSDGYVARMPQQPRPDRKATTVRLRKFSTPENDIVEDSAEGSWWGWRRWWRSSSDAQPAPALAAKEDTQPAPADAQPAPALAAEEPASTWRWWRSRASSEAQPALAAEEPARSRASSAPSGPTESLAPGGEGLDNTVPEDGEFSGC